MRRVVATALTLTLLAACGDDTEAEDQASRRACNDLRDIASDWNDGIIGPTDLAGRMPAVVRNARGTQLHPTAVEALDAATRLDDTATAEAVARLDSMCNQVD